MNWFLLRALILGLAITPASGWAEASDTDAPEEPPLRRSVGHVVRGPQFLVWEEDQQEADAWAAELEETTDTPHEMERWRTIADRSAALPPVLTDEIEAEVASWGEIPGRCISPLGCLLCLLPSLDRTILISSWATSASERDRRGLARALAAPFEAVGVRAAIEELQADPSPEIRQLAGSAAESRSRWSA